MQRTRLIKYLAQMVFGAALSLGSVSQAAELCDRYGHRLLLQAKNDRESSLKYCPTAASDGCRPVGDQALIQNRDLQRAEDLLFRGTLGGAPMEISESEFSQTAWIIHGLQSRTQSSRCQPVKNGDLSQTYRDLSSAIHANQEAAASESRAKPAGILAAIRRVWSGSSVLRQH